jgi:hypothetical protein
MDSYDFMQHYDFYIDNCTEDEIPLNFEEWEREYGDIIRSQNIII